MKTSTLNKALSGIGDLPEREERPILAVDLADSYMDLADSVLRAGDHENAKIIWNKLEHI